MQQLARVSMLSLYAQQYLERNKTRRRDGHLLRRRFAEAFACARLVPIDEILRAHSLLALGLDGRDLQRGVVAASCKKHSVTGRDLARIQARRFRRWSRFDHCQRLVTEGSERSRPSLESSQTGRYSF